MADLHPIFNDVERRAIVAEVVKEGEQNLLVLSALKEDGSTAQLLKLNKFDAKQLSAACDRYMHQQNSIDYSNVNTLLTDKDRVELYDEDED